MSTTSGELRARNLRTVLGLAALFFLPLAAAFWLYYGAGWRPAGSVVHGELIQPVRPLPAVELPRLDGDGTAARPFGGKWTLVYVGDGRCDPDCRRALYVMRQVRLALNDDMTRVERVLLVTSGCCDHEFLAREHPGLVVLDAGVEAAQPLLAAFPEADRAHMLFVVDPRANLMMRYDARTDPRGLLADLERLLRLSRIG